MTQKDYRLSATLLHQHLANLQQERPAYSLRAFARDLECRSSYVSEILSGKKPIPMKRLSQMAEILRLDELAIQSLKHAIVMDGLRNKGAHSTTSAHGPNSAGPTIEFIDQFKALSRKNSKLWEKWYYIAVLDYSTCNDFRPDAEFLSERLRITVGEATEALEFLTSSQMLTEKDGRLIKSDNLIRLKTTASIEVIRSYHKQMMTRAAKALRDQTADADFQKRLISGLSIACRSDRVEEAKLLLQNALHEISRVLSDGECDEVYHLAVQLFPVTRKIHSNDT